MFKVTAFLTTMFLVLSIGLCFADSTVNVDVRARVPEELELTHYIRYAPPGGDPYGPGSGDATSIDFGTLSWNDINNIWVANEYFTVFLIANSSGRAYRIQQSSLGLASGGADLNNNLLMTPDYQENDELGGNPQGAMPAGDSLGAADLAFGINKAIYNGDAGLSRIIRCYYGLATGAPGEPAGAEPIISDQLSGAYTGTITFSLVLQ